MEELFQEVGVILMQGFFVNVIFTIAKKLTSKSECRRIKAYTIAVGISAILAAISWANYGTHTEDADPMFGGGKIVMDFEPSKQDQNKQGMLIFMTVCATSFAGVYAGLKARLNK